MSKEAQRVRIRAKRDDGQHGPWSSWDGDEAAALCVQAQASTRLDWACGAGPHHRARRPLMNSSRCASPRRAVRATLTTSRGAARCVPKPSVLSYMGPSLTSAGRRRQPQGPAISNRPCLHRGHAARASGAYCNYCSEANVFSEWNVPRKTRVGVPSW